MDLAWPWRISVDGFELLSAQDLKVRLSDCVSAGQSRLVIDLGDVPFIDSSGLGALISGLKAARQAGGDLRIARAGEQPSRWCVDGVARVLGP